VAAISRRDFLRTTATSVAVAGFAASAVSELSASPYGWPIGIQIFPLRQMIDTDFRGTMRQVADAGFQTVELLSPWYHKNNFGLADMEKYTGAEVRSILGDLGLRAVGSHVDMTELRGEELPKLIQWATDRGLSQICVPSLDGPTKPPNNTMDTVKKLADEYNKVAEASAKAGLEQGLHTEGFELSMVDGKRVFDLLFDLLDPKLVKFQFQMSTITSGLVAADYFTQHPGRFISMHLQDLDMNAPVAPPPPAAGAPAGRSGRGGGRPQRPIGQGSIDWVKTFTAAKVGGVKNYFVEMNLDLAKASVPFLKALTV
jgi:sugar phosphate isomerase/epimerase